ELAAAGSATLDEGDAYTIDLSSTPTDNLSLPIVSWTVNWHDSYYGSVLETVTSESGSTEPHAFPTGTSSALIDITATDSAANTSYQYQVIAPTFATTDGSSSGSGSSASSSSTTSTGPTSQSVTTFTGLPQLSSPQVTANVLGGTAVLNWTYQGNDDDGFELEAKDQDTGENFHLIQLVPRLGADGQGIAFIPVIGGRRYAIRMRVDYTEGTVSDYLST